MAAELDQLGRQAQALAMQFRKSGQPHFADMLSADGKKYKAQAAVARKLGAPESFSPLGPEASADISTPPDGLLELQEKLSREGFSFEPIHYPRKRLTRDSRFWDGKTRPQEWFWQQIDEGRVSKSAANLSGKWALIESVQKPQYDYGRQMYYGGKDPLGEALKGWRKDGRIAIPSWARDVPANSRFAVSADETDALVVPHVTNLLGVKANLVGPPREIEFNVAGNLNHPEWGQTNTWEWFADQFELGSRLVGGDSALSGLAHVNALGSGRRHDDLGFRLQVSSPSKA